MINILFHFTCSCNNTNHVVLVWYIKFTIKKRLKLYNKNDSILPFDNMTKRNSVVSLTAMVTCTICTYTIQNILFISLNILFVQVFL